MTARFVGRATELARFEQRLEETRGGHGRLVALTGEAGMGKTRLMAELARRAEAHGARVLWSQMIEDPAAPPYFPWLLALRGYVQQADDAVLAEDLGSSAVDVADLLPELRDRLRLPASRPPRDRDAARFQLYDAVTRLLLAAARRRPLVLLFDNLHLADRSSLRLLEYYGRHVQGSAALVVAAFRVSELADGHPLKEAIGRSTGTVGFEHVELPGLARDEVGELLQATLGTTPRAALVEAVHARGDGNPLFVAQVAADLARRAGGGAPGLPADDITVPDSLKAVIGARLDMLGRDVVALLATAAVLGRDFESGLLAQVSGADPARVFGFLDGAVAAGVVASLGASRFRFHHALFREVLYGRHGTTERTHLHETAARQIEARYAHDLEPHVPQLAFHWFEASRGVRRMEAVHWCRRAAAQASDRRAYGEAAQQLERALQCAEAGGAPEPGLRYELLTALADAQYRAGMIALADQTWLKAALQAHHEHWVERLADAVLAWQQVRALTGLRHVSSIPLHEAALERLPAEAQALRARLLASLAQVQRHHGRDDPARATLGDAVALARRVGEPEVLYTCLSRGAYVLYHTTEAPRQHALLQESLDLARCIGAEEHVLEAMTYVSFALAKLGRIAELRKLVHELTARAEAARHPHYRQMAAGFEAQLAIAEGRWEDALHWSGRSLRRASLEGLSGIEGRYGFQMFAIQRALGGLERVAPILARITAAGSARTWLPGRILLHCEVGQLEEARRALEQLGDPGALPEDDLHETALVYLAEACTTLRDTARCRELFARLKPRRGFNLSLFGTLIHGAAAGYLAMLAAALSRTADARRLFEEALESNAAMDLAPLLARTRVDYAEFLALAGTPADRDRVRLLLAEARAAAEPLGMQPLLRRIEQVSAADTATGALSERELAVLRLVAAGASNKRVAAELSISLPTVATHLRNILRKTGAANRTEAVTQARRAGLLPDA